MTTTATTATSSSSSSAPSPEDLVTDLASPNALPVADTRAVVAQARRIALRHRPQLLVSLGLTALAAATGLVTPRLIGDLVQHVSTRATTHRIDVIAGVVIGFVVLQTVLTRVARARGFILGEKVLAELREEFVDSALDLPIGTVERAGTGDLLTRTSRDVDQLSRTARFAVPETLTAIVTVLFTLVATALVGLWVLLPLLVMVPFLWVSTRWYLRRAKPGYLRENATWARLIGTLTETVEGARTVEAMRLAGDRMHRTDSDLLRCNAAERYTLRLRMIWFPAVEASYLLPTVATLLFGGWLHLHGHASLAAVTAATLYVQQLIDPLDALLSWVDELQVGGASLARLLGVSEVDDDRQVTTERPDGRRLRARDVRFAYTPGRDVLHGVDLDVRPGERLAMVGPSGAGKSTLGRLLAGIHPPRAGSVTVGGVAMDQLPLEQLRREVCLVTQEHHVFAGTVRDNLVMALPDAQQRSIVEGSDGPAHGVSTASVPDADDAVWDALRTVDAADWVAALPEGIDTQVGSGGLELTGARAQQIALARLVLVDPHTLVLDEATSLIDPRAARHLERSLATVLEGRTVVAIAHRLYTAHDADRVAVVEDGRISELGSHDELVEQDGSYADLWRRWNG